MKPNLNMGCSFPTILNFSIMKKVKVLVLKFGLKPGRNDFYRDELFKRKNGKIEIIILQNTMFKL